MTATIAQMPYDIYGSPLSSMRGNILSKKNLLFRLIQTLVPSTNKITAKARNAKLTIFSPAQTVDTQPRVTLCHLSTLYVGQSVDRGQTGVFCKRKRNGIESAGECAHSVLLNCGDLSRSYQYKLLHRGERKISYLISALGDGHRSTNLGSSTTVDHPIISHKVTNNTNGIVQCALSLVNDLSIIIQLQYCDSTSH